MINALTIVHACVEVCLFFPFFCGNALIKDHNCYNKDQRGVSEHILMTKRKKRDDHVKLGRAPSAR